MATVKLRGLCKLYDGNSDLSVRHADLLVNDGEFVVIVGPSGCGKSTILRVIAGLESATAGDVFIGDRRVNDVPARDRGVAMVFQNYALYPHLSVYDNLAFGMRLRHAKKGEIDARVNEAADILRIGHLLQRKPRQLSGGERQRVAVGRAITRHPSVFLFDEPLSNLDAKLRAEMRGELISLHKRLGATMVYVTHDQVEAMTMGDRIVVMDGGAIQQVGTPGEVYSNPANRFVAGFIGTPPMNMLAMPDGRTMGIRPEHLQVPAPVSAGEWGDDIILSGDVSIVERCGSVNHVHFKLFDGQEVTVNMSPDNTIMVDALYGVSIRAPLDKCMFFDKEGRKVE